MLTRTKPPDDPASAFFEAWYFPMDDILRPYSRRIARLMDHVFNATLIFTPHLRAGRIQRTNALIIGIPGFTGAEPETLSFSYAKPTRRIPTVLSHEGNLSDSQPYVRHPRLLMVELLYGSGLRLQECLSLRVKDGFFTQHDYRTSGQRR